MIRLRNLIVALVFLLFLSVGWIKPVYGQNSPTVDSEEYFEAIVTEIVDESQTAVAYGETSQLYQQLEVMVTQGRLKGERLLVESGQLPIVGLPAYQMGDRLVLIKSQDFNGSDVFFISDYVRRDALFWLGLIFVILTLLIAKKRGLTSLLGMVLSFLIIFQLVLPLLLKGSDPICTAILGSCLIIPLTFYLSHGFNQKTTVAVISTVLSLVITGVLAGLFVNAARLTGFASEEAGFLQVARQGTVNIRGLLLAGMIIGALGILDDITIAQSAVVNQLKQTSPQLKFDQLYCRAMTIGQDHISSMVNTLILVYTGAALPLLLLFIDNPQPLARVINYELIAEEIVRTLVGSIGLILAVPITTFIAALTARKNDSGKIK